MNLSFDSNWCRWVSEDLGTMSRRFGGKATSLSSGLSVALSITLQMMLSFLEEKRRVEMQSGSESFNLSLRSELDSFSYGLNGVSANFSMF